MQFLQFIERDRLVAQPLELVEDHGLSALGRHPRAQGRADLEQGGVHGGTEAAAGIHGQLLLHQCPVQPAAAHPHRLAAEDARAFEPREHAVEQEGGEELGVRRRGRVKRHLELGDRAAGTTQHHPTLTLLRRLNRAHRRRRRAGRDRLERLANLIEERSRVEVPDRDHHRVVGRVIGPVMMDQVVPGDGQQIALVPDDRVPVGMDPVRRGLHLLGQGIFRVVLRSLPFGDDHRALALDLLGFEERVPDAVRLDADAERKMLRGQGFIVRREILPREAVPAASVTVDEAGELPLAERGGALEEHVLHPMGDPGDPGNLVAAPDAVPDPERRHRRGMHFPQQHDQAVGQYRSSCRLHHRTPLTTPSERAGPLSSRSGHGKAGGELLGSFHSSVRRTPPPATLTPGRGCRFPHA